MSYDENRISDQIDGGLNEKEQMQIRIDQLEVENKSIKELLISSECPTIGCDNNGTIAVQISEDEWEPQQCQWCDERKELLNQQDNE